MSAYLKFFELEKSPFDTRAQSSLVLGTKALRGAFTQIESGLDDGAARICLDGKAGLGKTSLARALPKLLGEGSRVVLILNPSLPWSTLRAAIVRQLDLAEGNLSRKTLMRARSEGRKLVIVIDQAERISNESLEHLDILLGYKSDDDEQLIQCVLLANLEVAASMHSDQGEQCPLLWWLDRLNTLQLEFHPIPPGGVASYVKKHLKRAGWKGGMIFTADAMQTIHRLTGGVPREMSDLCERSLELAAERETESIDVSLVEECFGEIPLEDAVLDDADFSAANGEARDTDGRSEFERTGPVTAGSPAARNSFSDNETAPTTGAAETGEDPRIDRVPSAGRREPAGGDGPLSLESFFGDSTFDAPTRDEPTTPRNSTASHESDTPFEALHTSEAESAFDDEACDGTSSGRRTGPARKIALAAGMLLVLGVGTAVATLLLGSDDEESAPTKPAVLARRKPATAAKPAPIAGIESPSNAEPHENSAPLPRSQTGDHDLAALTVSDRADAGPPAPWLDADKREARAATRPARTEVPVVDRSLEAAPEWPEMTDDLEGSLSVPAPGDPAAMSGPPSPERAPASPAPAGGWEDPAEAEVDTPFW